MSVTRIIESARAACGDSFPLVIGTGVALIVIVPLVVTGLRRRRGLAFKLQSANPLLDEKAAHWAPPEQSYADRRESVRREGAPVRVLLSSPTLRNGVNDGFVVDRSTGGLRIVMQTAMAPGSTMQVRAANAPDNVGFVTLLIRSCRKNGDHYELGCEFEKTPPWNVLLLFG